MNLSTKHHIETSENTRQILPPHTCATILLYEMMTSLPRGIVINGKKPNLIEILKCHRLGIVCQPKNLSL